MLVWPNNEEKMKPQTVGRSKKRNWHFIALWLFGLLGWMFLLDTIAILIMVGMIWLFW